MPETVARLHLRPLNRPPATNQLSLAISLPLRNTNQLAHLLQDIYNPASPGFRHYLTPEQFTAQFGPTESDYQAVLNLAKRNGLKITSRHPNRVVLDVAGSVAEIEHMFHVRMHVYRHPTERRTFYAPDTEPSLDGSLAVPILNVSGLDDYSLPQPTSLHRMSSNQPSGRKPETGSGPGGAYLGKDFRQAYVPGSPLDGTGQTAALVEFDGYYTNDITAYETLAVLPRVKLTKVTVDGGPGSPATGMRNAEVSLDIEMVIAMAPNVANVLVYEAPFNGAGWLDMLNRIANDNLAPQISCSWDNWAPIPGAEQIFQQMAAQGQSFFAGSGDFEAFLGFVNFPDDSPSITMVGGTTLTMAGGARIAETVWNQGLDTEPDASKGNYFGSSGGISPTYPIPLWQQGINSFLSNGGSTTARNVPDVALTAQHIYVKYGNGSGDTFSGCSCAAPLWAGFIALVNQQAAAAGQPRVGFINPAIYEIANESVYGACFNDIVTGNNTWPANPHAFYAGPGYDLCTGLGTPKGTNLINALVSPDPLIVVPNGGFNAARSPDGTFNLSSQTYYLTNAGGGFTGLDPGQHLGVA
jgi:subtilase family serine protease